MANKSPKVQLQFISQNLSEAQAKINDAKALLKELETSLAGILPSSRDLPGIIGKFDGTYLVTDDGKKIQVPENYAGKSKLVFGDSLKMIEESDGSHTFKQIERVPRTTLTGVLVKKDGKFVAVTSDGSHSLIPAAVSFQHGQEGDEVKVIVPEEARNCSFAALDEIPVREKEQTTKNKQQGLGSVNVGAERAQPVREGASKAEEKVISKSTSKVNVAVKPPKPATTSISVEPEINAVPIKKEEKPAPAPAPKPKVERPVIAKPAVVVKSTPKVVPATAPPPSVDTSSVSSILGDDDLR